MPLPHQVTTCPTLVPLGHSNATNRFRAPPLQTHGPHLHALPLWYVPPHPNMLPTYTDVPPALAICLPSMSHCCHPLHTPTVPLSSHMHLMLHLLYPLPTPTVTLRPPWSQKSPLAHLLCLRRFGGHWFGWTGLGGLVRSGLKVELVEHFFTQTPNSLHMFI